MPKKKKAKKRSKPGFKHRTQYNDGIGRNFNIISDGGKSKISNHHKKLMREVNEDVNDMIDYRKPAVKFAEEAILGYMALSQNSVQGRSSFFPPTLHAIVYSRMALESASMPFVQYKHKLSRSEPKMKFINAALENAEAGDGDMRPPSLYNWYMQNFDKLLFGVGFRHLSYLVHQRVIHVKDNMGMWREKKALVYDDIWDEHLSFFHTGVSRDAKPGLFGASAAYNDKFFRREMVAKMFLDNPNYFNVELALEKFKGPFLRLRRYWNLPGDLMFCQFMDADDDMAEEVGEGIPCREDYILEYGPTERPRKMIPITSVHGDFNFDMKASDMPNFTQDGRTYTELFGPSNRQTFWTKGHGQMTKGLIGIKRAMWRATHDNMKASTVFFAMSQNPGVLSQIKKADMYGIVPLKADERSFNVKALLERNQAFAGIQEYDEAVDNLAASAIGHDWRQSASQLTNEQATVSAIRENIKHVRSKQGQAANEAGPISRHYLLMLNLIQQFYPEKTQIDLMPGEKLPDDVEEPDIVRDADGTVVGYMKQKNIKFAEPVTVEENKDGTIRVRNDNVEGNKLIPASKNLVVSEEEPEIYIKPGSTFASMQALERAMSQERLKTYQFYMGLAYPNAETKQVEPLIGKSGAEYLLRNDAELWNDDPDDLLGDSSKEREPPQLKRPYSGGGSGQPTAPAPTPNPPPVSGQAPQSQGGSSSPFNGVGMQGPNALASALTPRA